MTRLLLVVLVLAAGVIALGLVGLWRSATSARETARAQALQAATLMARGLRGALRDDRMIELLPEVRRFEIAGGALVVPEEVGWVDAPPASVDLPWDVRMRIDEAADLEFRQARVAAARARLEETLATRAEADPGRDALLVALAWTARRAGDADRLKEIFEELDPRVDRLDDERFTSWLLLAARAGRDITDAVGRWRTLAPAAARTLLARLADHDAEGATAEWPAALAETEARRETLRAVSAAASGLIALTTPRQEGVGTGLLLWFPAGDGSAGRGVLAPSTEIVAALEANRVDEGGVAAEHVPAWSGRVAVGEAPVDAVPVVADIAVAPDADDTGGWAGGGSLIAALAVLGVFLFVGMGLVHRAARQEALAAEARADFLTSVTHEFKTPLASIRLLSEMLDEGRVPTDEKRAEYHQRLSGEAARLSMLIENVLDLRRMERGERAYDRRRHDLGELVGEAAELFRPVAEREGLSLEVEADAGAAVRVDRAAVIQSLLNVMDNARKYGADGGRLVVRTGQENGAATVTLRDFGPGVPAAERDAVFERFRRGERERAGAVPGVGLGLYLARMLTREHGGELALVEPGDERGGACFRMTLPVAAGGEET